MVTGCPLHIGLCVDIVEQKLEVAKLLGADQVIKVDTKDSKRLANQIKDAMGVAPNVSIECTGVESSVATAIYVSMCMTSYRPHHILPVLLLGNSFRRCSSIGRAGCSHGNHSHSGCVTQRSRHQRNIPLS